MGIIELILDNWFLAFIALAFFSSLFKRRNQPSAGQGKKNSGGGMPTFGGHPFPWEEPPSFPELQPNMNSEKTEDDPVRTVSGGPVFSVPEPEEREDINQAEARPEGMNMEANPEVRNIAGRNPQRSSPAVITRSRLAEAVVWSEILGPPRAKRPFRYRSNRLK